MKNKKAQIQMGENIIILFVFFVLLIFAVVFYTRVKATQIQARVEVDVEGRGMQIAQKVKYLPELQCTRDGVDIPDCYDEFNARAMQRLLQNPDYKDYYYDVFGYSTISLQQIFPPKDTDYEPIMIYDNSKSNSSIVIPYFTPIVLCGFLEDAEEQVCNFAVLKVEIYN